MKNIHKRILFWFGSLRLALVLVILLIIVSFMAIVFPQQSEFSSADIEAWSEKNPGFASFARFFGGFSVFRSLPFLIIIILFAVNILICTILHILKLKKQEGFRSKIRLSGFLLLHLSLLGILAGGFITTSSGMTGTILLTEGQVFTNRPDNYIRIAKGPLKGVDHNHFKVRLNQTNVVYERKVIPVRVSTSLDFRSEKNNKDGVEISINHPYEFMGLQFTQDEIGFSPRISIRDSVNKKTLLDSFMALKTFREGYRWQYTDFIPLQFLPNKIYLTLYPDHRKEGDRIIKTGELPDNPILLFEERGADGKLISKGVIPYRSSTRIGLFHLGFHDLRYWTSFGVKDDPGYLIFGISVWLALLSLILRYSGELRDIFTK